jgi:hypothetical protein
MKVLGLALQKLAAFTSSSWLPKEISATMQQPPAPVQLARSPSLPQQQQLAADPSSHSSSSFSAAVAAATILLKQRDASLSKLLGLIDEWQLLPCFSKVDDAAPPPPADTASSETAPGLSTGQTSSTSPPLAKIGESRRVHSCLPLSSPQVELVRAVANTATGLEQQVRTRYRVNDESLDLL